MLAEQEARHLKHPFQLIEGVWAREMRERKREREEGEEA